MPRKRRPSISLPLGPANLARLRTHPHVNVTKVTNAVLDELLGPAMKAKNEVIAKLSPEVEKPGDAEKGKALFTVTCAICHKFGDLGADIGPGLTGMGAHGPAELLVSIVDPNREVDPSFVAWNIETKDGNFHAGVIARENPTSLLMKSLAGQEEIKIADIKARVNTGRSLMPEGFEALGAETLRNILTYICGADAKFRILDLSKAFTATTLHGIYAATNDVPENFHFAKTGMITLGGIPFDLVAPDKSANGKNVIQLKGGADGSYAKTQMPKSVEISGGGFKANRLHFLGNVAGWGFPYGEDKSVVLKATVQFVGGASEVLEFRNGIEFADYINRSEVPGSKFAEGVTKNAQVRWCSKQLKNTAPIEKIILESADNNVAPSTFGITAELADANAAPLAAAPEAAPAPAKSAEAGFVPQFTDPVPQPPAKANGPRVLLIGGGSSHDFVKFFGASDKATLTPVVGWVDFTQNLNGIAPILKDIDVIVLSANQPISSETKKALIDFANAGKGIVALHPGTWYAWDNFPQWNKEIIGGGTRGHDALGPYTVKVTNPASPITKGVTGEFRDHRRALQLRRRLGGRADRRPRGSDQPEERQKLPTGLHRQASEIPHRRHHPRPRRPRPRFARVPDPAQKRRALGRRKVTATASTRLPRLRAHIPGFSPARKLSAPPAPVVCAERLHVAARRAHGHQGRSSCSSSQRRAAARSLFAQRFRLACRPAGLGSPAGSGSATIHSSAACGLVSM